jgi:glucosamine--fructose-6-phosphate aminotransferase (isomerizing)
MRARGAEIILATDGDAEIADILFSVPRVDYELFPVLSVIPWQLIAYYTAVERGVNPDRPRNLAKSVTVK